MSLIGRLRKHGLRPSSAVVMATADFVAKTTVATITTGGASTYTAAQILGGLILRDPAGADRSDVTPTAALLATQVKNPIVGTSFDFVVRNTADAFEVITLTAGSGVTLSGKVTISRGESRRFIAIFTAVGTPAVTIYDAGLVSGTYQVQAIVPDISTASSVGFVVAPYAGRLIRVYSIIDTAITTGDAVLTIATSVGNVTETITIANAGSAAGDIDVIQPAVHANTVVAAGTLLKATSNGGSTVASKAVVVFEIERD